MCASSSAAASSRRPRRALRILETSHPPNYYIPLEDIDASLLEPFGRPHELLRVEGQRDVLRRRRRATAAPSAPPGHTHEPAAPFEELRGYVAFYVAPMDRCTVDGEVAAPEERPYYGGWVTSDVLVERGA